MTPQIKPSIGIQEIYRIVSAVGVEVPELGVGYGFFFVDDGVGGIEAVGGVVVVAGSEVVEVGGLFAFFVGELGFGGVVDGLAGLDFFAEGAVGG